MTQIDFSHHISVLYPQTDSIGPLLVSALFNRSYQTDLVTQAVALRRWRTPKTILAVLTSLMCGRGLIPEATALMGKY